MILLALLAVPAFWYACREWRKFLSMYERAHVQPQWRNDPSEHDRGWQ